MSESVSNAQDAAPAVPNGAVARWVITGEATLLSPAVMGPPSERRLVRDRDSGAIVLPGATLHTLLQEQLAERLGGYGARPDAGDTTTTLGRVFSPGVLECEDALSGASDRRASRLETERRKFSGVDASRGISRGRPENAEIVPAGQVFRLRVDLCIGTPGGISTEQEAAALAVVAASLEGIAPGGLQLGARRSRGFGEVKSGIWRARRFDLTTGPGREAFGAINPSQPIDPVTVPPHDNPGKALQEVAVGAGVALPVVDDAPRLDTLPDQRRRMVLDLKLRVANGVLVRDGGFEHVRSSGLPVLPGTVLAGALRERAFRIARLSRDVREAARLVDGMFGPRSGDREHRWASRVRVSEAVIEASTPLRVTRLPLDRLTQGSHAESLTEQPEFGGRVRARIELREPKSEETGLLLLAAKDLLDGDLTLGGATGTGRGSMIGQALASLPPDMVPAPEEGIQKEYSDAPAGGFDAIPGLSWVHLQAGRGPHGPGARGVDACIRSLGLAGNHVPTPAPAMAGAVDSGETPIEGSIMM